jgi:nicotinamidase/pyrazinamidase
VVRKGHRPGLDSYSGFAENDRKTNTGLDALLRGLDVRRVFIAGLATDYCVHFTATDAIRCGFETVVVSDACHGINQPAGSLDAALKSMRDVGVSFVTAGEVERTG